jgi:hypothetical protein
MTTMPMKPMMIFASITVFMSSATIDNLRLVITGKDINRFQP